MKHSNSHSQIAFDVSNPEQELSTDPCGDHTATGGDRRGD
jgi:hypothetical protein